MSAAVPVNESGVGLAFSEHPPAGDAPDARQDCQGAYEWARGQGALHEGGLRLRITFRASRYLQLDGRSLSARVVERSDGPGFAARFSCGQGRSSEDKADYRMELPYEGSESEKLRLSPHDPMSDHGLSAGEEVSVLTEVDVQKNTGTTRFEVVLEADVNGVARTFVLRDGDRPFTVMSLQGGAGFSPDFYYWCPGAPGRLVHQPGDDDPLDAEPAPEPPC